MRPWRAEGEARAPVGEAAATRLEGAAGAGVARAAGAAMPRAAAVQRTVVAVVAELLLEAAEETAAGARGPEAEAAALAMRATA
jgi:hypothetical protein